MTYKWLRCFSINLRRQKQHERYRSACTRIVSENSCRLTNAFRTFMLKSFLQISTSHNCIYSLQITISGHTLITTYPFPTLTQGRKMAELLHDIIEGRDYGPLKELISDRSGWRQDNK